MLFYGKDAFGKTIHEAAHHTITNGALADKLKKKSLGIMHMLYDIMEIKAQVEEGYIMCKEGDHVASGGLDKHNYKNDNQHPRRRISSTSRTVK